MEGKKVAGSHVHHGLTYHVETKAFENGLIEQTLELSHNGIRETIIRQVLNTAEAEIQAQLRALGWVKRCPALEKPKTGTEAYDLGYTEGYNTGKQHAEMKRVSERIIREDERMQCARRMFVNLRPYFKSMSVAELAEAMKPGPHEEA